MLSLTGSCVGSGGRNSSRGRCGSSSQAQAQKLDPLTVVLHRAPTSKRWWGLVSYPNTRHPSLRHQVVRMRCVFGDRSFLKRHCSNDITLSRGRVCNATLVIYTPTSQGRKTKNTGLTYNQGSKRFFCRHQWHLPYLLIYRQRIPEVQQGC